MEQFTFTRQILEFNKSAFDNSFNAILLLQEQSEKMMDAFIDQAPWVPGEGKKAFKEIAETFKKNCRDYKTAVDESFARLDTFFEPGKGTASE